MDLYFLTLNMIDLLMINEPIIFELKTQDPAINICTYNSCSWNSDWLIHSARCKFFLSTLYL